MDTDDIAPSENHPVPVGPDDSGSADPSRPAGGPRVAVGVDLLEHARLLATHARHGERFLARVFTERERAEARDRIARLAGRFAAKEACAKALGTGIGQVMWREIEIVRGPGGKPTLLLHGAAAERARQLGLVAFDVSISDTATHVSAIVVGVG